MKDFSYITNSHPAFIESLYQDYISDPNSVDPELKKFFEGFDFAISSYKNGASANGSNGTALASSQPVDQVQKPAEAVDWKKELGAYRMILGYRNKGHLIAKTNPIRARKDRGANLDLGFFGFTEEDLDRKFNAGTLIGLGITTLTQGHLGASLAGLSLAVIGIASATPLFFTVTTEYLSKVGAAAGIALISSLGNLGAAASPAVTGAITARTGSPVYSMYLVMGLYLLSGIILLLAVRSAKGRSKVPA